MEKIKVAVVGYGNIGKYAIEAVKASADMELVGVVRRANNPLPNLKVVTNIDELDGVDVALLCSPSRAVPELASQILAKGINTVDSFDIHGDIYDLRQKLNPIAKQHNACSVIAAGWDPGSDSVVRALMKTIVPKGITYTNFGPGMSMGHSVVAKSKEGVEDALAMTMPAGDGMHRRIIYLQMKAGASFEKAAALVKEDSYFVNDECQFIEVKDIKEVIDFGHGVFMTRKGVSGQTHNQMLSFEMRINNPALTSQVMVAYARATMKMEAGCYTTIEVPVIKTLAGKEEEIIRELV